MGRDCRFQTLFPMASLKIILCYLLIKRYHQEKMRRQSLLVLNLCAFSTMQSNLPIRLYFLLLSTLSWLLVWKVHRPQLFIFFAVVQFLSHVRLFVVPRSVAHQASLSFTISQNLLKLMSFESVMPSNHLILCCPILLLPSVFLSIRVFSSESTPFSTGGQTIGASASASVLPMNIQDWFPLGLSGWISLQSKGL